MCWRILLFFTSRVKIKPAIFSFPQFHHGIITDFISCYKVILWFINTYFQSKVMSYCVCTHRGANFNRLIKNWNSYFFLLNILFWDTLQLWKRKLILFFYIFVTNCQFFQINLSEYAHIAENWHALWHEKYFSKHWFLDICQCSFIFELT